ncbi:SUR7/PalI family-domain-containing protein [Cytidiella melzeri]|nr:SUR7/PalI family-domain-containing protein [Cytidiella melzeri]
MPQIIIDDEDAYGDHHHHHGGHHRDSSRRHRHHRHHSRWRRMCPCFGFRVRSSHRLRYAVGFVFLFLTAAFILYLLVTLSLPIIRPIYLFQLGLQPSTNPEFFFGVWGFCTSSAIELPTILTRNNGECSSLKLGYDIPQDLLDLTGYPSSVTDALVKTLTVLLILHPVSAGLSLLTLFFALFIRSQYFTITSLIVGIVTAVVGSVVLAADLALVIVANNRLKDALDGLVVIKFGAAVWMIVAAVALSWLGVIALSAIACRCCRIRRKHGWYGDGYYD